MRKEEPLTEPVHAPETESEPPPPHVSQGPRENRPTPGPGPMPRDIAAAIRAARRTSRRAHTPTSD